jgi:hypothetical protein
MSDVLPFGRLCYGGPNAISNAIGYAIHYSRSHHAVIRVYDDDGNERMRILPQCDTTGAALESGEPSVLGLLAGSGSA